MKPDMSVSEMLDSFIFIVKGSRVIDRRMTNWGDAYWLPESYSKHMVYSAGDMKRYFAHRVVKSKWKSDRRDPFNDWLINPAKFTAATLAEAMKLADAAARGEIEPRIDVEALLKRAAATKPTPPPWR